MPPNIAAALVRAIAPPDLADAIIGDLHESYAALVTCGDAKALASARSDVVHSLLSLLTYRAPAAVGTSLPTKKPTFSCCKTA